MKRYSDKFGGSVLSELNVTPLIDLAFTLMIIFMITAPLIEQSLELNLPNSRPQQSQPPEPESIIQVEVNEQGVILMDGVKVSLPQLESQLRERVQERSDSVVALRADAALRYQQLVYVFDAVKASGARLGLTTLPGNE
ncbi:MAG: biopolymer transporter ExbD [Verrucomicrobiota bacterium]